MRTTTGESSEGDEVRRLIELSRRRREVVGEIEREEAELVRRARTVGLTWQQIAACLDVSKQAVHKKYGRR